MSNPRLEAVNIGLGEIDVRLPEIFPRTETIFPALRAISHRVQGISVRLGPVSMRLRSIISRPAKKSLSEKTLPMPAQFCFTGRDLLKTTLKTPQPQSAKLFP